MNTKTEMPKKEILSETGSVAWEIVKTIVGVTIFVIFFRFFIIQPFYILGSSMLPGFHEGEYLFIDEASYHLRNPVRGEVIVFRHPDETCTAFVKSNKLLKTVVQGPCKSYIKRVVGLPGETVRIENGKVTIINSDSPSGYTLNESYIKASVETLGNQNVKLKKGEYFVLGDNREPNASSDSREWGPLTKDYIIGRAWLRLLPVSSLGFIERAPY
jgi:signal peptidase I